MVQATDTGDVGTGAAAAVWGLANPPSGAQTVLMTFSASTFCEAGAITVTGSDTVTCFSNSNSALGTSAAASVVVTSTTGELVVDAVTNVGAATETAGGSQTLRWGPLQDSNLVGSGSSQPGASSVTMSWTLGSSQTWGVAAASFKAGASAAASIALGILGLATAEW
jgi:hypothetical protein